MPEQTLREFLAARIIEDEVQAAREVEGYRITINDFRRVRAECRFKLKILELDAKWPTMVTTPTTFEPSFVEGVDPLNQMIFRASQQVAFLTNQEYLAKFGSEPPTSPILAAMARIYAHHPDFREEWL